MLTRVQIPSPNHGGLRPHNQLLVVHTSEGATTFRSLGRFLSVVRPASYHVGFDNTTSDSIGEYVQPQDVSWSAHAANQRGEHGCCCTPKGAAQGWTRETWLAHPLMLQACKKWLQEESARYGIPLVKINGQQIKNGIKGVCGHKDCVDAGLGGTHTDPGPAFPWDVVLSTGEEDVLNDEDKQWIRANIQSVVTDVLRKEGVSGAAQKEHSTVDDDLNKKLDQILGKLG